jgi:hypothetical protein
MHTLTIALILIGTGVLIGWMDWVAEGARELFGVPASPSRARPSDGTNLRCFRHSASPADAYGDVINLPEEAKAATRKIAGGEACSTGSGQYAQRGDIAHRGKPLSR